jgi:hypothetical protein
MRTRKAEVLPRGEVVAVRPALLSVASAATYCACSASLLNALRAADAKAQLAGKPTSGPVWVHVGYGIRYRLADLDSWISRTGVPGGVMESRRRGRHVRRNDAGPGP